MIWILGILQIFCVWIGWWVYRSYYTQPRYNHPAIFWNPLTRTLLTCGPTIGIVGLVITAFFLTAHPWIFLIFTLIVLGYNGRKSTTIAPEYAMPVLTEDDTQFEAFSTDNLLEDIRAHKLDVARNKSQAQDN